MSKEAVVQAKAEQLGRSQNVAPAEGAARASVKAAATTATATTATAAAAVRAATGTATTATGAPATSGGFTPITSQDELDRIVTARIKRERAKYADYELLKEKAALLDELKCCHRAACVNNCCKPSQQPEAAAEEMCITTRQPAGSVTAKLTISYPFT